ncbi:MAG: hypothetical protein EOM28_11530 [Clostridia bacterium]|nr:hypothetical protein [Clostridia bacterium]
MSGNIKGITVEIGGDVNPLSKALKAVNSEAKGLQKELNGVESLLKLNPSNVDLLRQKEELLNRSIGDTNTKITALKAAKAQADRDMANGTQVNQKEYRNLVREIAATEGTLDTLKNQMKEFGSVAQQQLKQVGEKFGEVGGKIEGAGKKLAGVSAAAGGAVAAIVGIGLKAASTADEINTLSKQTGLSVEEIQKYQYSAELLDVSFDTLQGSMAKLTKNMANAQKGTGDAKTAFEELGVQIIDSSGNFRDNEDVFADTIEALGNIENETQRDAYAMAIFGKSAQDLNPLILGGADALKDLGTQWEELGIVLSQEELNQLNEVNDQLDTLKAQADGTLAVLGAEIMEALLPAFEGLVRALSSVLEWVRGLDDGTIAIITTILAVVAAIGPLLIVVGKIILSVQAIIGFIPTLTAGFAVVKTAIAAIGGPITIIMALIGILIAKFVHTYQTSEEFRNKVNAALEAVRNTVTSVITAIKNKVSEFISIGKNMVEGIWQGIQNAKTWLLNKVKEWCGSVLNGIKAFFGIHSPSTVFRDEVGKNMALGVAEGIKDGTSDVLHAVDEMGTAVLSETNDVLDTFQQNVESRADAISSFAGLFDAVKENTDVSAQSLIDNLSGQVELLSQWQNDLQDLMSKGISDAMLDELREQGPKAAAEIHALTQMSDDELGAFGELYAQKIKLSTESAIAELGGLQLAVKPVVSEMAENAAYAVKSDSGSPKQETDNENLHTFIAETFATALLEGLNYVGNSIFDAIPKILDFYIDSVKMAKTTWDAFDGEGDRRNRMFAPTYGEIYSIALRAAKSVSNTD